MQVYAVQIKHYPKKKKKEPSKNVSFRTACTAYVYMYRRPNELKHDELCKSIDLCKNLLHVLTDV